MPELRNAWADALNSNIRKIYGEELKQVPTQYQNVFTIENSSRDREIESSASGLSQFVLTGENQPVTYEDRNQGYDVTYTHQKWAKAISISKEMWDDDRFGVMKRGTQDLARSKMRTKDSIGADIFNYSFTSGGGGKAPFTAGDAVALFSASHPRSDGGAVQSNTTTTDFNEASLETALVTMRATLDDKGELQGITPDTLLIAPALEKEARILLESSGRVGTANNDTNPYQGRLNIVVWDRLGSAAGGSDTAWFVLDKSYNKLIYFNRMDTGLQGPDYDFDNDVAKWKDSFRCLPGWSDWRGIYGSKGDNS
jgi:phage major head subunit gpT-like protein